MELKRTCHKLVNSRSPWLYFSMFLVSVYIIDWIHFRRSRSAGSSLPMRETGARNLVPIQARMMPPISSSLSSNMKNVKHLIFEYGEENLTRFLDINCRDNFTVPPIVHYTWIGKTNMKIYEYISVYSSSRFLRPCYILFHGNIIPAGKWWNNLLRRVHNIIFVRCRPPSHIFTNKLSSREHQSDVLRLEILMRYGGIYLDGDVYVLRSFDTLRQYPLTLSREGQKSISNGIILANKTSNFLKIWYLTYSAYNNKSWAENSVWMANRLCKILPGLVHVEQTGMILLGKRFDSVYNDNIIWPKAQYSVHLYAREFKKHNFELEDINKLDTTFGRLSRYILVKDISS